MCGIAGFFEKGGVPEDTLSHVVKGMIQRLIHRGPDGEGSWVDREVGIALGHRRLAVVDLSEQGYQPMSSACGRFVIVFNGEIYNHKKLRSVLEHDSLAPQWRGHSDTEVMLAAFSGWGVEKSLELFVGMFAFALWDRRDGVLYLGRDRLGEKPLYYGWQKNIFLFASELKALRAHPAWRGEVNRNVLQQYMRYAYIPAPYSIFRDIYKLPPGSILRVAAHVERADHLVPHVYWSLQKTAEKWSSERFNGTERDAETHLENLLRHTLTEQTVADVPIGAFLSGGVDSSTIVALLQSQSNRPVKTFTIGFHEQGYNEAEYAKAVARHLGTEHTEYYVTSEEAMAVVPRLPFLYDEPFADSSQIPTFLVSQLARQQVTVSLSGDGADELFGGYNRHVWGPNILKKTGWMPLGLREIMLSAVSAVSPMWLDRILAFAAPFLPPVMRQGMAADKLFKLAEMITWRRPADIYLGLVSLWKNPGELVLEAGVPDPLSSSAGNEWCDSAKFCQWMMYMDTVTYLPDDILVKVDRAAMGVSLETRAPFLDHRLVEFAWRLPMNMKIRDGHSKWILRQVLYKYVPRELIERPKSGFAVPIDTWLRGPLRAWAEDLLAHDRLQRDGFFALEPIRKKWQEHLAGRRNWQHLLWNVLMFQAWKDIWEH